MDINQLRRMAKAHSKVSHGEIAAFRAKEAQRLNVSDSRVRKLIKAGQNLLAIEAEGASVPKNTPIKWLELVDDPQATARALAHGVPMRDAIHAAPEPKGLLLDEGTPDVADIDPFIANLAISIHDLATQVPIQTLKENQQVIGEALYVLTECFEATIEGESK